VRAASYYLLVDTRSIASPWGNFIRASTTLIDGEVLVFDWFVREGEPEITLRTSDPDEAEALLPNVAPALSDLSGWHRRATDAVVHALSTEVPSPVELDDAASDLALQTVEAHPGGEVVLHLDDTCGEHLLDGHWPAVRFGADGSVIEVTVEA
jgi:hypothetical protein